MKSLDDLRHLFLFVAAAYLVLVVPHTLAAHQHGGPSSFSMAGVIAGVEKGLEGMVEAQEATGAFFPGN